MKWKSKRPARGGAGRYLVACGDGKAAHGIYSPNPPHDQLRRLADKLIEQAELTPSVHARQRLRESAACIFDAISAERALASCVGGA